jgi:hypothetical protein
MSNLPDLSGKIDPRGGAYIAFYVFDTSKRRAANTGSELSQCDSWDSYLYPNVCATRDFHERREVPA